jgi:glycogen operon protein
MLGDFASRIAGSADLYAGAGKGPERSINYVTAHDGFTMNDLVSYDRKHNEANGEGNRDGTDTNYSENYGVEGETDDPEIQAVRRRQVKNFLVTLFVSRGVPMLLGGDEFRRTQEGNNNAYCQDNEISWYDWTKLDGNEEIHRFTRVMIAFRQAHPVLRKAAFYTDDDIRWYSSGGGVPPWGDPGEKCLACTILGETKADLHLMFNASTEKVKVVLPDPPNGGRWHVAADTSAPRPDDLYASGTEKELDNQTAYERGPRSSASLVAL